MLQEFQDLGINLLAASISFGAGLSATELRRRWRSRSSRAFWKPFADGEFRVVTPVHRHDDLTIDKSEWLGQNDLAALLTLQGAAGSLRIPAQSIRPASRLNDEDWRSNLILIGGPSTNTVTGAALERLRVGVGFGSLGEPLSGRPEVHDRQTGRTWSLANTPAGNTVRTDHGIVVRAASPFNSQKTVLVIAGATSYGTAGAARLCESSTFLDHPAVRSGDPFEAVCSVDIAGGAPREVQVMLVRPLS
ncbi:hypothetical protein [Nocardia iowensis]|uniref:S-layer protein C-terminal domain-containing protein n=1 Tax=Nocardia iowensis TaxID=204891 RepID=A0ABX8RG99_NOCIO|nr:hypothetical protein [Nocardia iowensis]QXN88634.1 hypothetical protein KV110_23890 [Nocardia iowensis]